MAKRRTRPDGTVEYTDETARTVFHRGLRHFLAGSGRIVLYVLTVTALFAGVVVVLWLLKE